LLSTFIDSLSNYVLHYSYFFRADKKGSSDTVL
jgi:hypothetical protein